MYITYITRRTQIYLEDEQNRQLTERARQAGRSKSAVIREAIDTYLTPASSQGSALARFRAAIHDAAGAAPYLPPGADYVDQLRSFEGERRRSFDHRH